MKIENINNKAFIEQVCLDDVTKKYNTPMYIYSQKIITKTYKNLKENLLSEIFYAVKANSNQAILKLMEGLGAGADVVSRGELQRSIGAGFNPNKIIYEGLGKSLTDIEYAVEQNIRLINIESINEIFLINQVGKNANKKINIGIRLNPNIDGKTLDKISTGKKNNKFGIDINELPNLIEIIHSLDNINLIGISCHIGSQIKELDIFKEVFHAMKKAAEIAISKSISIQHVDLGGGLSVDYNTESDELDIKAIGDLVASIFNEVNYTISFEPGRYLVAKSGVIITKILTTKKNGDINYLITDAGMQTLIRPALYNSYHRVEALNSLSEEKHKYTLAGPICESSDIIAKHINLPKQKIDNYIAIHDVGAYGAVMASNYNTRGIPAEILINENQFSLIHKEESVTDIIKRDLIPDWL